MTNETEKNLRQRAVFLSERISLAPTLTGTQERVRDIVQALLETRNEALEECAEIVERQLDINSETGGDEELTTARNLILALKTGEGK